MDNKLIVSSSPHIGGAVKTKNIMIDVIIALVPALIASVYFFGPRVLVVTCASVATCVVSEYICRKVMKRPNTIGDCSAIVTGILLAYNLPSGIPVWVVIIGGVVAIVVAKQMFGGIGHNFVNPALTARIVLMVSFPTLMTTWPTVNGGSDAVTSATPLGILAAGSLDSLPGYLDLLFGNHGGSLGETCALALLLGGIYLIIRRVISPIIPVTYIAVVVIFAAVLGQDPIVQMLSGGLFLGAIFMATDYTTCPLTNKGKFIYATGCGLLTTIIRAFGSLPEGVSFSIIIMNILVPHIEKLTMPKVFGTREEAVKE